MRGLIISLLCLGCTGEIGDAPAPFDPVPPVDTEAPMVDCTVDRPVGIRLIRRLTTPELVTTLRTVFEMPALTLDLPLDPVNEAGLHTDEHLLLVRPRFAAGVHEGALALGEHMASRIEGELPCASGGGEACAMEYVTRWGRRLYRRPLSNTELSRYRDLFTEMQSEGEAFDEYVRWATVALVDSPHMIYRSELGEPRGERYELSAYELATELAYTFTGGPPDDALLDLAEAGLDRDAVRDIATRLAQADSPDFREVVRRFGEQWLRLPAIGSVGKDDAAFTAAVRSSMLAETEHFLEATIFEEGGSFEDLLTSNTTYLDGTLASFYGFGDESASSFVATSRPDGMGIGLLAQGGLLAVRATNRSSSPTRRGLLVRRDMLCQPVPPAPVGVDVFPETDAVTTRERHQVLVDEPFCSRCHRLLEPIGFALERFDEAGRVRSEESGIAIDESGFIQTDEGDVEIAGAEELAEELADLGQAQECFTSLVGAYSMGMDPERTACLVSSEANAPVLDQFLAVAASDHFFERVVEP
ncbi:MAG: DUF1592 domain-containing protein [Polyangiales bacterium]